MNRARLTTTLVLIGVLLLGVANVATAAKKNKLNGQDLYKEYCKPCHEVDSENGEYTPMSLIQDQWGRFFEEDYEATHSNVAFAAYDGKNVTDVITPEMLEVIAKFSIDHAADSENPMTCG